MDIKQRGLNAAMASEGGDFMYVARLEPIRNRVMLAFAYDAGLRREELCSLRTDDIDMSASRYSEDDRLRCVLLN